MTTKIRSAAVLAAVLASPGVFAGVSGNVGATSDYMFRGVTQTGGPAVQGGIDYENESGFYIGTWASNIGFAGAAGGTEQDVYTGFAFDAGPVALDLGLVYYWYPEGEEGAPGSDFDTLEFALSAGIGPVTLAVNHGSKVNFFIGDGDGEAATYIHLGFEWPLSETLTFNAGLGQYSGDEIERALVTEDSYMDYSIGLAKDLGNGYSASFTYVATDISADTAAGFDDDPKLVIGMAKSFDL